MLPVTIRLNAKWRTNKTTPYVKTNITRWTICFTTVANDRLSTAVKSHTRCKNLILVINKKKNSQAYVTPFVLVTDGHVAVMFCLVDFL